MPIYISQEDTDSQQHREKHMVKGLYTAYTGMVNEQKRLDTITNNLANASTTGYKKEALVAQSFDEKLAIKIKDTSSFNNQPEAIGNIVFGVKVGETWTNWEEGAIKVTDNPYDVALTDTGFFAIEYTNKAGETSIKYTRDGSFTVDSEGYLRTVDGDYVLNAEGALTSQYGEDYRIRVNPDLTPDIASDGTIYQDGQQVAQIGIIDIDNYDYINKYGDNLYDLIDGGNIVATDTKLKQGCLESSNVKVVDEMVDMIEIARAYEAGQKMIQTEDSSLDKAVNSVGRV